VTVRALPQTESLTLSELWKRITRLEAQHAKIVARLGDMSEVLDELGDREDASDSTQGVDDDLLAVLDPQPRRKRRRSSG